MSAANVETFRAAHQAFNRRDFKAVVNAMTDNVTYRDLARGVTYEGHAGFIEFMQGWVTRFSDAQVSDPSYLDAGDVVIAEFMGRGVNDGPFGPLPATGKRMDITMCEIVRFDKEGKVVAGSVYYDQVSILTQLGVAQSPGAAAGA